MSETSTKPYLLRAIYEWCTDNGFTPYLAAQVDANTRVPQQFVKNGEIVLNISFEATSSLKMDNESVNFSARFGGVAREISVPVDNVIAIYARENGQGMAFEVTKTDTKGIAADEKSAPPKVSPMAIVPTLTSVPSSGSASEDKVNHTDPEKDPEPPKKGGRPTLTRIK
ncbi:ClpXP protease specificity-enhancing factor [Glaciimonas sp. PCH181]|uniref:ClpXP protease specificity-enhancing factor n=1 Tax=Glaciimonas sp. PCH181 TaxID=2133943 RepID=UPI000D376938|nr:ClpXP protease specificity-enhancing factor [Glaciimonas sp. PCH181]PUA16239.1 ClpXP protease specificity-enhancing factor [Glaciimonas sp. PCH181]